MREEKHEGDAPRGEALYDAHADWTPEERALYDARAEEEAWGLARKILGPLLEAARPIGSSELSEVMQEALSQVDENLDRARRELERLERRGS